MDRNIISIHTNLVNVFSKLSSIFSLPPQEKCPPGPRMQKNMKKRKIPLDIRGGIGYNN
jgi:hypothetical protein